MIITGNSRMLLILLSQHIAIFVSYIRKIVHCVTVQESSELNVADAFSIGHNSYILNDYLLYI